jgi:cell wall-associated NlpC family hydrolase
MGRPRWEHGDQRRRFALLVAASLAAGASFLGADPVAADPIDNQRQRVQELTDALEQLEETSDILAEDYVTALDEQRRLEAEVAAAAEQVAEREAQVHALRGDLADVAVQTFMGAGTNGLGPVFNDSSAYTEDLQRDQLARVALSAGDATTDELDEAVADLNEQRGVLEDREDEAAAAAAEVEQAQQATEAKKTEYQQARSDAESELGRLIQEEEERRARESYERMQREAEEAAARAAEAQRQAEADAQRQAEAASVAVAAPPSDDGGSSNQDTDSESGGGGGNGDGGNGGGGGGASSASSAPNIPPASSRAETAVNAALTQLGVPYQFAQSSPGEAFDCSGLTAWAWAQAGVSLPHQSRAQAASIPNVPPSAAQPGDLIFYYSPISHVGIYIGNGQLVHAPNSGDVVKIANVNWGKVTAVGRPG